MTDTINVPRELLEAAAVLLGYCNAHTAEAYTAEELRALLQSPAQPVQVQGWQMVPVEPTPEMMKAARGVPEPVRPYPAHYSLIWDAMLAAAPKPPVQEPSQTAGMTLAERIAHVGGRTNADGYIEFGSVQAVRALIQQVLRDLPKAPQPSDDVAKDALRIQVCKLGRLGAAYDPASTKYAYTYTDQPDNVGAMKLGQAAAINAVKSHGDNIDRGLHLLLQLQAEGFGVYQIDAAMAGGGV